MKRFYCLALILVTSLGCKSDKESEKEEYTAPTIAKSPELQESITRGSRIYNNFCATCHLASGEGIANAFPPLNNSDWLKEKREASIRAVKFGLRGPIEVNGKEYNSLMADLGLEDQEVADVMNYVLTSWDNNIGPAVTLEEVEGLSEE